MWVANGWSVALQECLLGPEIDRYLTVSTFIKGETSLYDITKVNLTNQSQKAMLFHFIKRTDTLYQHFT
jgi:hypothetical protein